MVLCQGMLMEMLNCSRRACYLKKQFTCNVSMLLTYVIARFLIICFSFTQVPGLNRVCKKLRIDCAPAVIGFDFHSGACHPTFDGFVVCEEFSEKVVEEWFKDQEDQERKEEEKYEKRVYGNWKRLIRGLMIRERLRAKYNFEDNDVPIKNEGKSTAGKGKKK